MVMEPGLLTPNHVSALVPLKIQLISMRDLSEAQEYQGKPTGSVLRGADCHLISCLLWVRPWKVLSICDSHVDAAPQFCSLVPNSGTSQQSLPLPRSLGSST